MQCGWEQRKNNDAAPPMDATTRATACGAHSAEARGLRTAHTAQARSPNGRCSLQVPAALIREQRSSGWPGRLVPKRERQRLADSTHMNNGERRRRDGHTLRVARVPPRRLGRGLRHLLLNGAAIAVRRRLLVVRRQTARVYRDLRATGVLNGQLRRAAAAHVLGAATSIRTRNGQIAATDRNQRLEQQSENDAEADHLDHCTSVSQREFDDAERVLGSDLSNTAGVRQVSASTPAGKHPVTQPPIAAAPAR